ncbi:MAG TPA: 2Fe-2S iron-sulfur cluster-binding protein [Gemmatimonadales bacterium]|nr:2Fe-2S iron-sulfur cluster-binding protein [Gemmatimonadales bacterium]
MADQMVTLTIDGQVVEVPKGTMLIEAAKQAGILVPHYCYHPSLPSPAVCRMCLVQVEKLPKMVPSCVTAAGEGQVVHVHSPEAVKARAGVLEFLLINHPLDCPICDQSGECELQDFVFQEGNAAGRYADYPKRYNPVENFGPDILYIVNRCILCTRCVRFMESVALEPVLTISERGDRAFVDIDHDRLLDHAWSGNVVDLCPVGSLVSKDFLHKARAWDLDKTASICSGCSQGCNISIDTRDEVVVRLRPRPNLAVNHHFMCDTGRADYRWMNRGDRVERCTVAPAAQPVAWDTALDTMRGILDATDGPITVLFGRRVSVEGLGWVMRLVEGKGAVSAMQLPLGTTAPLAGIPDLALRAERGPNAAGAALFGVGTDWERTVSGLGPDHLVLLVDVELSDADVAAIASVARVLDLATVADPRVTTVCRVPVTNMTEETGVFVNRDGRAQRFLPARTPPGDARPTWWVAASTWARQDAERLVPATAAEAFALLPETDGLTHRDLGFGGALLDHPVAAVGA